MRQFLIIALILASLAIKASPLLMPADSLITNVQAADSTSYTFQQVDSIMNQYSLTGSWDKLLKTGKEAIRLLNC